MSKNLKRIIAMAMVIGTISVAAPAISNATFLTTKAYASSDDENDDDTFKSLKLETSDGSSIRLYDDDSYDSDSKVDNDDVDPGEYYAKTSSNKIHVDISGVSSKYVRVFRRDGDDDISDSTKGKKVSSDVSLSSGKNTIVVRIYDEEPDDSPKYEDDDDKANDYTIHVKCTGSDSSDDSSDDDSDNNDDIYLKSLSINGDSVSLSDSQTTYTYNVASNVDSVSIKAKPEDEDEDTVEIDGDEVDDGDNYKKDVDLNKGENDFKVKLTDEDDNERDYTLKITRADNTAAASTGTSTAASQTSAATAVTTAKVGWVQANGGWQYYDATGTLLKSQWFFDRSYGKWYYLGADGMMAHDTYVGQWKVGSDGAWIS